MMRVILLVNQNLNKTFYKNFELNYKNNKIDFQIWSLLFLTNNRIFKKYSGKNYRPISHPKFQFIKNYKQIFKKINGIKKKTYVLDLSGSFIGSMIEFLMIKKGCLKIKRFETTTILQNINNNIFTDFKIITSYGCIFFIKKILRKLKVYCNNILLKIFITKPNYYITSNKSSYDELKKKISISKIYKYNSSTFNQFKNINYPKSKKKIIVFIDQEFEKSFESQITNRSHSVIDKEKYWKSLNKIFNHFENKLKMKVKIAAHFRRSNNKNSLPNIGRKFFFDKTPELIKESKLVIGHDSLALNYAILMKKPIVLLNFKIFDSIALQNTKNINLLNKAISSKIIHVDNKYKFKFKKKIFQNLFKINKKKYNKFQNNNISFYKYTNVHQNMWSAIASIK